MTTLIDAKKNYPNGESLTNSNGELTGKPGIVHRKDGTSTAAATVIIGEKPYISVRWEHGGAFDHINWDEIERVERIEQ